MKSDIASTRVGKKMEAVGAAIGTLLEQYANTPVEFLLAVRVGADVHYVNNGTVASALSLSADLGDALLERARGAAPGGKKPA